MWLHLILYILAFTGIWLGSGLAIRAVEKISHSLHLSSFAVSFIVLGFFTSISEMSVGLNSVFASDPEIYIGNLIGASIVIFILIVPLLAVTTGGIKVDKEFAGFNLLLSLIVIATPVIISIDGVVNRYESLICIIFYLLLVMFVESKKGVFAKSKDLFKLSNLRLSSQILKIIIGIVIIFFSSRFVVEQTLYFSQTLSISPFIISLLIISIGTNIPEFSLVIRSIFMKNNQIAFGDYVGSAAFNTLLFGALTILYGEQVVLEKSYIISLLFLIVGLTMFYLFARSRHAISRREGLILLTLYFVFVAVEALQIPY